MNFKFYKSSDTIEVLNKSLDNEKVFSGEFIDDTNVETPILRIKESPSAYNKIYIERFARYYDFTYTQVNGYYVLNCEVDVLLSFKSNIESQSGIVKVNGSGSPFLNSSVPIRVRNRIQTKAFPTGFSDEISNFVLIVQGGA